MLAVHWTPVKHTKTILKNGIRKSKNGLFCFPLTGLKSVDRWWIYFFNQCGVRQRKKYNGIVFRITKKDLPAYFGHWGCGPNIGLDFKGIDGDQKEIIDLKFFGKQYRKAVLFRLGELIARSKSRDFLSWYSWYSKEGDELFLRLAETELQNNPKALTERLNSIDFMSHSLSDYQIVLSNSIPADRIIKVIPQGDEFGRVLRQRKKYGSWQKDLAKS
jgi:hypothetical protein